MKLVTYIFALLGLVSIALTSTIPRDEVTSAADGGGMACKEGELICAAANDAGKDGGVFQCTNGYWKLIQDCRSFERCIKDPTPHCTWAKKPEFASD